MYKILLPSILLLLFVGCTKKGCVVIEENGVKIFKNSTPNKSNFNIELNLENEIALEEFGSFTFFDSSKNGDIFIYNKGDSKIYKFDKFGKLITTFGSKGEGPGEYSSVKNVLMVRDCIFLFDPNGGKVIKYSRNGIFQSKVNSKQAYPFIYNISDSLYVGNFLEQEFAKEGLSLNSKILLLDKEFKQIKMLDSNKIKFDFTNPPNPFDIISFTSVDKKNSKFALALNSESKFEIDIFSSTGDLEYKIRKGYKKIFYSEDERGQLKKISENFNKKGGGPNFSGSKVKKAIGSIYYDKNGRLWVLSAKDDKTIDKNYIYFDIFEEGVFLNTVKIKLGSTHINQLDIIANFKLIHDKVYYLNNERNVMEIYNY